VAAVSPTQAPTRRTASDASGSRGETKTGVSSRRSDGRGDEVDKGESTKPSSTDDDDDAAAADEASDRGRGSATGEGGGVAGRAICDGLTAVSTAGCEGD